MSIAAALLLGAAAVAAPESPDADEVRALVAEMIADARTRTSLVSETAGHDGRFFVQSEDGAFRLTIHGFTQFRYTANWRDIDPAQGDDWSGGFAVQRSRLFFEGHVHEDIAYRVRTGFSASTGLATLEQAFMTFSLPDEWKLRAGQFSLALFRDDWIEAARQLAVNSSAVNVLFGQGQSEGVQASRQWEDVRLWAAFSDGISTQNTDVPGNNADAALTSRFEWRIAGDWSRFDDYTSFRGSDFAMLFGAAVHWETNRPELAQLATDNLIYTTADLGVEGDGWNLFAAFVYVYRTGSLADDPTLDHANDAGVILQGGFFISDHVELFARYDHYFADDNYQTVNDITTWTAGFNWYAVPGSHMLKFSANVLYAPDSVNGTAIENNTSVGLRTSDGEQWVFQAQMQVMY